MKSFAILFLSLASVLAACTDTRVPAADGTSTAMAGYGDPAAMGHPQDASQTVVRRVWADSMCPGYGGLTPDGRYMTFVDWFRNDLGVRDMHTGEIRYLTDRSAGDPEGAYPDVSLVSPDGQRVAYAWYPGNWVWEVHIVDLDGKNRKRLLAGVEARIGWYDWTPDGREILLGLDLEDDGPTAISLVSVEDGSVRVLKEHGRNMVQNARVSPDGRYVVYDLEVGEGSRRDLFILSVDDGRDRPLLEDPSNDRLLGWVPGTDYVLFTSDRTGSEGVWILEVRDGKSVAPPLLVKSDLWGPVPVGFTADGAFYYGVWVSARGAHLANIDPETKRMLGEPTPIDPGLPGQNQRPQWSPDGRYLAYLKRNGRSDRTIAIRSMETGDTRYIEAKMDEVSRAPRWSPDGRSFLLNGWNENGHAGLFQVDVQTGEALTLKLFLNNGQSYWSDWAPDGKTVYYRVDYGEESRIEAFELESGATRVLRAVQRPDWIVMVWVDVSPDGRELAFWEWGEDKARLFVIPTAGEQSGTPPREVLAVDHRPGALDVWWSEDGRYLMYQMAGDGSVRLWRVPARGGEPEPLELMLAGPTEFSPDGTRIAFDYGESAKEIWVMENYLPER